MSGSRASSRSLSVCPCISICFIAPLRADSWICCPQLPCHPGKNGTHGTSFCKLLDKQTILWIPPGTKPIHKWFGWNFSCIRAATTGAACILIEMNSLKNLANMWKMITPKIFSWMCASANTGPACIRAKINSTRMFSCMYWFCAGGSCWTTPTPEQNSKQRLGASPGKIRSARISPWQYGVPYTSLACFPCDRNQQMSAKIKSWEWLS